jgi:NAD(P)-dependent dehydrogenase (short-subunit alcohol dehydrogenase family)
LTKSAGTQAIQIIAREVKPEDMQVISFHPGLVYTPMSVQVIKQPSLDARAILTRNNLCRAAKIVEKDAFPWDSGSYYMVTPITAGS